MVELLFAFVLARVHRQAGRLGELFRTEAARVRTLAGVEAHVRVEAARLGEGFVAQRAVERFGAGVHLHVLDEIAGLRVALAASDLGGGLWSVIVCQV